MVEICLFVDSPDSFGYKEKIILKSAQIFIPKIFYN